MARQAQHPRSGGDGSSRPALRRWAATLDGDPAAVLADLAGALGLPWAAPGGPSPSRPSPSRPSPSRLAAVAAVGVGLGPLPDAPAWELLDAAREALVARDERRRLGAHHTPPDLARRLVALALDGVPPGATVLDPACGGGAFLVAAALARPDVRLVGIDLDPLAVATTAAALAAVGRPTRRRDLLSVGDGLALEWEADVVVGNPPFLSPLGTDTAGTPAAATQRADLGAPYLDAAALFLLRAAERAGRVVLLQPESVLTSRDARVVRERLHDRLEGLWVAGEPVFAASVRVCAPVLGAGGRATVRRWRGSGLRPAGSVRRPAAGAAWGSLRPTDAPAARVPRGAGRLGDLATASAGFRDEFYGIAAAVREATGGRVPCGAHPVVTSGLVDPGRTAWGERPARIGGRRFAAPVVDPADLEGRVAAWVAARLVPKVLLATQTRVVEAAADPDGHVVPLTPVVSVAPQDPADVWRVAAALTSPLVTAWALRTAGGSAMSGDALKLSASQVLAAPLPADAAAWAEATEHLRAGDVVACGTALAGGDGGLLAWWRARLPAPRTV